MNQPVGFDPAFAEAPGQSVKCVRDRINVGRIYAFDPNAARDIDAIVELGTVDYTQDRAHGLCALLRSSPSPCAYNLPHWAECHISHV